MPAISRPGPTSREWAQHREVISRLYWDEDKTLKQVVDYMRSHHGFQATDRMYKLRLKNWGLVKNLKADEADRLLDDAYNGAVFAQVPTIRGRAIGSTHFKRRLNRVAQATKSSKRSPASSTNSDADSTSLEAALARRSEPPMANNISAPAMFGLPETCLRMVWQFSHSQFSNGQWDLSGDKCDFGADKGCVCWFNTNVAAVLLMEDRMSPSNWQLLRKAFDQHDSALIKPNISIVWGTCHSVLKLSLVGKDLARVFLRWITGLAQVRLGRLHPLAVLFGTMGKMEVDEIRLAAENILKAQFDVVSKHHRPRNIYQVSQHLPAARKLYDQHAVSFSYLQQVFTSSIEEMRKHHEDPDNLGWAAWAAIMLSHLLIHEGRGDEARTVLITICQWLETFPPPEVDVDSLPESEKRSLRLLNWLRTCMGPTRTPRGSDSPTKDTDTYIHRIILAMVNLEHSLGRSQPGSSVSRVFEDDIDMILSDDLRAMRIADGHCDEYRKASSSHQGQSSSRGFLALNHQAGMVS
ncbi:Clr5 domain-containing protein [Apiospora arundinis]|uniref:Clr5 domain-containing protein n=1 Tax=Apiospora arundinis TaxID=335852 RepID=A0ABR2HQA6_9PEZI